MPELRKSSVIIVGSGGREHALGWKLGQSRRVREVLFAPGNGGTGKNLEIKPSQIDRLVSFAKLHPESLTVVGSEEPLSLGIVDAFAKEGLRIFGPSAKASLFETSKAFAKQFMNDAGIPTANFAIYSDAEKAKDFVARQKTEVVIKADGLAAGKGVIVCSSVSEATDAIDRIMVRKDFGPAGDKVVIEEKLIGEELSFIALCDGKTILALASSQDHKRVFDGDRGPNTGGMGAYSPSPSLDEKLEDKIMERVMRPAVDRMRASGREFSGFLYAGIMLDQKTGEPYVLEFNARMGDPECQPIMMRMDSDFFEYLEAAVEGRLDCMDPIAWKSQYAVCVVMTARGYPGNYESEKGKVIRGLDSDFGPDIMVFHAGTARDSSGRIVTNGGRVLGVTALGADARRAISNAYSAVEKISWGNNDQQYRRDIGKRAVSS